MKQVKLAVLLVLLSFAAYAQKSGNPYRETDNRALHIPSSQTLTTDDIAGNISATFKTDSDRVRAIFIWLAQNIEYDVENMYALNYYETPEEKMAKALKTRKGICEHYSTLFVDLCQKCGVKAYSVGGYTKQNGRADYIPHAWDAALIDGRWFLFDPTWGAGYIDIGSGQYTKQLNNAFYKVPPSRLIQSHMPFDPMWQFLYYPVTNQEFYEGKIRENRSKSYFDFTDSIALYERQDSATRAVGEIRRVQANGLKNAMIFEYASHLKAIIESEKTKQFNNAVSDYNEGVNRFNAYIDYWNRQFRPMRSDREIQAMFDACYNRLTAARDKLSDMQQPGPQLRPLITSLTRSIDDLMDKADSQKAWLKKYLNKQRAFRELMFRS